MNSGEHERGDGECEGTIDSQNLSYDYLCQSSPTHCIPEHPNLLLPDHLQINHGLLNRDTKSSHVSFVGATLRKMVNPLPTTAVTFKTREPE